MSTLERHPMNPDQQIRIRELLLFMGRCYGNWVNPEDALDQMIKDIEEGRQQLEAMGLRRDPHS